MLVLRMGSSDSNRRCRCSASWYVSHHKSRNSPWPCSTILEVPSTKGLCATIVFRAARKHLTFRGLTELLAVHFLCKWTPVWWILSATDVKIRVCIGLIISCTLCYPARCALWCILPPGLLPEGLQDTEGLRVCVSTPPQHKSISNLMILHE